MDITRAGEGLTGQDGGSGSRGSSFLSANKRLSDARILRRPSRSLRISRHTSGT